MQSRILLLILLLSTSDLCLAACPSADLTDDCFVDFNDFAVIAADWSPTDFNSLEIMANQWLTTRP